MHTSKRKHFGGLGHAPSKRLATESKTMLTVHCAIKPRGAKAVFSKGTLEYFRCITNVASP